jgi:pimeloyl-ACP methyl ester carboxylesterase
MADGDFQTVTANGIEFAYRQDGPADGPLALCLHGFPDTAHTWRHLLADLAASGYHAVAPWMRGYAPTSIAPDGAYQTGALASDANALHDALGGGDDAVLIGHDWGAFAAYGAAAHRPDNWRRVVAAAVPPPAAMMSAFLSYDQIKRSFYIFFFQTPLADFTVGMHDLEFIARLWADWSPGYDAAVDIDHVRAALGDPAHLEAAIGYYRAMFDPTRHVDAYAADQAASAGSNPQPTLYLHGRDDGCLGVELTDGAVAHLPGAGSRVELVDGAGHFLQLERPDVVNPLIIDFLSS